MDVKRCKKCGETKPTNMFSGNGRQKDGLHPRCIQCLSEEYEATREKARARARALSTPKPQDTVMFCCAKCKEMLPKKMFSATIKKRNALYYVCKICNDKANAATIEKARHFLERLEVSTDLNSYEEVDPKPKIKEARSLEVQKITQNEAEENITTGSQRCLECGEIKRLDMFGLSFTRNNGKQACCRECRLLFSERMFVTVPHTSNPKDPKQAKANLLEERRAAKEAYRDASRKAGEEIRAAKQAEQEAARVAAKLAAEEYLKTKRFPSCQTLQEARQTAYLTRKARILVNGGSHTSAEIRQLKEDQDHKCAYCRRQAALSEDHIIPLQQRGSDDISNMAMACKRCNSEKGGRTPEQWVDRWYERETLDPNQ